MAAPRLPRVESARGPPGGCGDCEPAADRGGRARRGEDRRAGLARCARQPGHAEARRLAAENARAARRGVRRAALGGRSARSSPSPTRRRTPARREFEAMATPCWGHAGRERGAGAGRGGRRHVQAGAAVTAVAIDRERLVETASRMVGTWSYTGHEQAMAELMASLYEECGLACQWQQVEDGRANALGTWAGAGGGASLMFNGHTDTSYSGREPWLKDVPGFQPEAFVRDGRLYGLGISNMKGALACYVEAVRALQDAGVRLQRRRARRGRLRRDREDAVRRRGRGGVPGLRRRDALPRHARRRRRHVPARRADRGQGRPGPLRRALAADPRPRRSSSTRPSARGGGARTRSSGCTRCSRRSASGSRPGRTTPRTPIAARRRSSTSARSTGASAGASRARRTTRTSASTCASRRRSP